MIEMTLYLLEDYGNGIKRYLISTSSKTELFDLTFFKGTHKQAVKECNTVKRKIEINFFGGEILLVVTGEQNGKL